MATAYQIDFDADRALQTLREYPRRTQTATARALNRALTTGRATMASLIAKDMGLKVGAAKETVRVRQATSANLEVRLEASLRRIPLYDFSAKGPVPSRGRGRGVTYKIGSAGRSRIETGFIARMASGHLGVFKRSATSRLPIKELFGPSVGHVFLKHREAGLAAMRESFEKNLAHELAFAETERA